MTHENEKQKYKVLIVDDDQLVIKEMQYFVDWNTAGFDVVATAHNGRQGLQLYKTYNPELIITDIAMPIMNGIDMIEEIRKISNMPHILIITAYDEFEYAKNALKVGVADYILKTDITSETFMEKLMHIHKQISDQIGDHQKRIYYALSSYFNDPLTNIQYSKILTEEIKHYFSQRYHCLLVTKRQYPSRTYITPTHNSFRSFCEKTAEYGSVVDELAEVVFSYGISHYDLIITRIKKKPADIKQYMRALAKKLERHLAQISGETYTVFFYSKSMSIEDIKTTVCADCNHSGIRFLSYVDDVNCRDLSIFEKRSIDLSDESQFYLGKNQMQMLSDTNVLKIQEQITKLYSKQDYDAINEFYKKFCLLFEALFVEDLQFPDELRISKENELCDWFMNEYKKLYGKYWTKQTSQYSNIVKIAIEYIQNHYSDPELSLSRLSEVVGVSSNYIGMLFKKEISKTVNDYITDYRVEKAEYYLENTTMRIYEVAQKVGYQSAQYFSQVFYKKKGRKPVDIRKSAKGE